jgi:SAM-dependent methyltransferase
MPIPWTEPYQELRTRTLRAVTRDSGLLSAFAHARPLPDRYGVGLDERCVEYPWLLSQMPKGADRLLDAGSSLNHAFLVEHPLLAVKRLHITTLAPEPECFWQRGISYVFEDLRALPFSDDFYDIVVSLSTIEHVGCDNTYYTGMIPSVERNLDDFLLAASELGRVLKPGGLLLLTVPYGRYQFHGAFQQFDRRHLSNVEAALSRRGLAIESESFYKYSAECSQLASDEECADCEYVEWVSALMRTGRWPAHPVLEPDYAAAARAAACVRMIKGYA